MFLFYYCEIMTSGGPPCYKLAVFICCCSYLGSVIIISLVHWNIDYSMQRRTHKNKPNNWTQACERDSLNTLLTLTCICQKKVNEIRAGKSCFLVTFRMWSGNLDHLDVRESHLISFSPLSYLGLRITCLNRSQGSFNVDLQKRSNHRFSWLK